MDRSGPRLPSPWWVLLPGVLLALAGVRAVTAEMDRAEEEAHEAATSVAEAVGSLVHENLAPLLNIERSEDVAANTRHLFPVFLLRPDGGRFDPSPRPDVDAAPGTRDAALRDDVLAACEGEPPSAAAALLAASAEAVRTPWIEAELRVAAAAADLEAGRSAEALEQLRTVLDLPPTWLGPGPNGDPRRAESALDLLVAATGPKATPEWVADVAERVIFDAWHLPAHRRLTIGRQLVERLVTSPTAPGADLVAPDDPTVGAILRAENAADALRRRALELLGRGDRDACALTYVAFGAPGQLVVQRRVTFETGEAWVCGVVPETRVRERLRPLRPRNGEFSVQSPTGPLLGMQPIAIASSANAASIAVPELPGWHADVRLRYAAGMPPSALLLAAAVLVATVSLIGGAFALSRAAREQARLAEERRTFLDHVAHEVRTPAAALLALSEELERGHVDGARQPEYHAHLLNESRRLADLVEETLDLTRLEGGRLVAKREPADMRDIVRDAVEAARPDDGRVVVTLPDEPLPVGVDRAAVRRAIRNLVDNALKHGAAEEPVEVTLETSPGGARVSVRDHGKGIPHEHASRVSERFYRVPSKTHEVKGVGLGLALVKEVAELHGGGVVAANVTGGGALFLFEVPLATGEESA